jgi:hypothetical protein
VRCAESGCCGSANWMLRWRGDVHMCRWKAVCGCDVRSGSGEGRRASGRHWRPHGCVAIDHIPLPSMVMRDLKNDPPHGRGSSPPGHQTAPHQQGRWSFAFASALTWTHPDRDEVWARLPLLACTPPLSSAYASEHLPSAEALGRHSGVRTHNCARCRETVARAPGSGGRLGAVPQASATMAGVLAEAVQGWRRQ